MELGPFYRTEIGIRGFLETKTSPSHYFHVSFFSFFLFTCMGEKAPSSLINTDRSEPCGAHNPNSHFQQAYPDSHSFSLGSLCDIDCSWIYARRASLWRKGRLLFLISGSYFCFKTMYQLHLTRGAVSPFPAAFA